MSNLQIRMKKRLLDFEEVFIKYEKFINDLSQKEPSELEKMGFIQYFVSTYELGYRLFYDLLRMHNVHVVLKVPKAIIKECAYAGFFEDADMSAEIYLDMARDRNIATHIFQKDKFDSIFQKVTGVYFEQFKKQHKYFSKALEEFEA